LDSWAEVPGGFLGGDGRYEADLSAEEAKAAELSRFPVEDGDSWRA